jgi:Tfp pilus assembly protein PilF
MTNAIHQFQRALELDPNFAEAYAGLASSYTWGPFLSSMAGFKNHGQF